ncbi:MAG: hypothetical protein HOH74_00275 [Gemmatimonadetes bacterium]|nr:hypothetical protein [Gemmatimonadota bacterium]
MMDSPILPLPIQIVLDDVGWWTSTDGSAQGGPFRSGMPRPHVPADYAAIAQLGRELNMRPQAAMMLCDWDRDLLLRDLPEATWMSADWDHPWRQHPHLDEAASILNRSADHLELVVHGLAHEWWGTGSMERAEWATPDGQMRPRHLLQRHLEVYASILERNGLGSLPDIFVPCAFNHSFGEDGEGIHRLLADHGIRYVSTPFNGMRQTKAPQTDHIAIECGVMTVDRGGGAPSWKAVAAAPPEVVNGPIVGLHWPNILHQDPSRNHEVVDAWVAALRRIGQAPDRWLAPDTPSAWSQLAHVDCTQVRVTDDGIDFDFNALDALPDCVPLDQFVIKTKGEKEPHFLPGVVVLTSVWEEEYRVSHLRRVRGRC